MGSRSLFCILCLAVSALPATTSFMVPVAFVPRRAAPESLTKRFLDDRIANMIDQEIYRQSHKKEFENEWMEKNRAAFLHFIHDDTKDDAIPVIHDGLDGDERLFREHYKDRKMAADDPARYCADRCLSTGNCDVWEDMFALDAMDAIRFCEECVLGDGDEPCDVPGTESYDPTKLRP